LSRNVEVVGELLRQLPAAEVAMEHLLAVLPRIPVVAAAEEILMMGNVPSNYTPYPTAAGSKGNAIQDGVNAAQRPTRSRTSSRQIGHVAVRGISQLR